MRYEQLAELARQWPLQWSVRANDSPEESDSESATEVCAETEDGRIVLRVYHAVAMGCYPCYSKAGWRAILQSKDVRHVSARHDTASEAVSAVLRLAEDYIAEDLASLRRMRESASQPQADAVDLRAASVAEEVR